jgi:aldehyde dehydrogenase (NAD+)
LIIAPWNYPFSLALMPLVSALAAGNTVMLKPSEMTPKTSQLIEKSLSEIFEPSLVCTVQGGKEIAQVLLNLPFDHIFFTGSTAVGKLVMAAASRNLSSVTLELGGKSPCLVHSSCNLELAAEKIAWGKFLNGGQTCVAPDFLYVEERVCDEFVEHLQRALKKQWGGQIQTQIITSSHRERLQKLVAEAEAQGALTLSAAISQGERHLSLTLLKNPPLDCQLMKEEIFGPVLPILTYRRLDEAVTFINDRPKPLALYIFANDSDVIEEILTRTSSGGVCVNDTIIHLGNPRLPFGGIGESGMGHYHGESGFLTFSHQKSVLRQRLFARLTNLFYPPYTAKKVKHFRWLMRF